LNSRFSAGPEGVRLMDEPNNFVPINKAQGLSLSAIHGLRDISTSLCKKANVIFFDAKPASKTAWSKKLWVYDFRTNVHKTLKQNRLALSDFDEFIECYKAEDRSKRRESKKLERWKSFTYDELIARDKTNLDIFWLRDESLEDTENLPAPEILAAEIVEQLEAALQEFRSIEEVLAGNGDTD
jgi:type I restriction enzyme M protein